MSGQHIPAQALNPDSTTIIDVRDPDEFAHEHIPNSQNIPLSQLSRATNELSSLCQQGGTIVLTCQSGRRAQDALMQLEALGLSHLCLLEGGLGGWKQARRQTVKAPKRFPLSVIRQVQLIAGLMALVGGLVAPLHWLAAIAGAGLVIAGLTNTCMLATLLARCPWNRLPTDLPSSNHTYLPDQDDPTSCCTIKHHHNTDHAIP
ncbi:MAG: rhodanese-like domain-containing protein [Cyanobacteria bacterium HKST-UBA04]|nr:rhodanese-like domain-containing protein [Cyanobacteria bacterium HKST-UBA04]